MKRNRDKNLQKTYSLVFMQDNGEYTSLAQIKEYEGCSNCNSSDFDPSYENCSCDKYAIDFIPGFQNKIVALLNMWALEKITSTDHREKFQLKMGQEPYINIDMRENKDFLIFNAPIPKEYRDIIKPPQNSIPEEEQGIQKETENTIKRKAEQDIVEYTFKGEFPVIKGMPPKDLRGVTLSYYSPAGMTEDTIIDLKDIVGFDANWEQTPITVAIIHKLNDNFYNNRLKIGEFKNDTIRIGLIFDKDNIYEGYLPFNVSVYKFIVNLEDSRRYGCPKTKADDQFEIGKFVMAVVACKGDEECIAKVKEEHQKILAEQIK